MTAATAFQIPREAGRELDALVAEHVIGWHHITRLRSQPDSRFGLPPQSSCNDDLRIEIPPYSTDIAAAWTVAVKLRLLVTPDGDREEWVAGALDRISDYVDGEMGIVDVRLEFSATAPTAPLAICRAALVAKGGTP